MTRDDSIRDRVDSILKVVPALPKGLVNSNGVIFAQDQVKILPPFVSVEELMESLSNSLPYAMNDFFSGNRTITAVFDGVRIQHQGIEERYLRVFKLGERGVVSIELEEAILRFFPFVTIEPDSLKNCGTQEYFRAKRIGLSNEDSTYKQINMTGGQPKFGSLLATAIDHGRTLDAIEFDPRMEFPKRDIGGETIYVPFWNIKFWVKEVSCLSIDVGNIVGAPSAPIMDFACQDFLCSILFNPFGEFVSQSISHPVLSRYGASKLESYSGVVRPR